MALARCYRSELLPVELQARKVEGGKELPITYTAARADTELS
jgi:hypothetical protein